MKKIIVLIYLLIGMSCPLQSGMGEDFGKEASLNISKSATELSEALAKAFDPTIFHQANFGKSAKTLSFCLLGIGLGYTGLKLIYDSFNDDQQTSNQNPPQPKRTTTRKAWVGMSALLVGISCIALSNRLS